MNHFANNQRAGRRQAFTLIEILIVIALTAVLFALLLIPLVSALNYTRSAQALTAAQDAVRTTREQITRELGSALYVFDNTSHPFIITTDPKVAGEDRYTNFLDMEVPQNKSNNNGTPQEIVAHAYNAKLDFVLPKVNDSGIAIDPTTHQPIAYSSSKTGSAIISSPSLVFPAAAGTTIIRWFVGLKDPTKPYNNNREMKTSNGIDNEYILYRVEFQPYHVDSTGKVKSNYPRDNSTVNEQILAPQGESDGGTVSASALPEFDDPDFFRYVTTSDVNWLSANHHPYTSSEVTTHNSRVDNWINIAKPVITGPNVDLILLPHDSSGKLTYDTGTAGACTSLPSPPACPGTSHTGFALDPVSGNYYPIVGTSVTFRPGTVSGNATPSTTTDYSSQAVVSNTDQNGFTYIPTVYTTSNQSWAQPYKVTLTPATASAGQVAGGQVYTTGLDPTTMTTSGVTVTAGDFVEYDASGTTVVYDITTGIPVPGKTSYIPLSINADSGTINFAVPALPDPTKPFQRQWVYAMPAGETTLDLKTTDSGGHVSPLSQIKDPTYTDNASPTPNPILLARIVPGSLRVYGPDATQGPGYGQPVLYTEATNLTPPGDNQYTVDYTRGALSFPGPDAATQFTANPTVTVIYDYQANMAPFGTPDPNAANKLSKVSFTPVDVAVDYQTRDLIDVSLGVRLLDVSTGQAQIIPSETKVKIGNSNR